MKLKFKPSIQKNLMRKFQAAMEVEELKWPMKLKVETVASRFHELGFEETGFDVRLAVFDVTLE